MDNGPGTEFQTISELHLLRHFRLTSVEVAVGGGRSEEERIRRSEEERFLLLLALDPEFYSYAHQNAMAVPTSVQWLEELGFVLALALVLPMRDRREEASLDERTNESMYEKIVTREKLRELDQAYPEIFMPEPLSTNAKPQNLGELLLQAHRAAPGDRGGIAPVDIFAQALGLAFPRGYRPEAVREAVARHSALRAAYLIDLEQFGQFKKTIGRGMDQLVQTLGENNRVDLSAAGEIIAGQGPMELIYRIAVGGVLLRWFRQLGPSDRAACFETYPGLRIEEASVRSAVDLAVELFGQNESTWERVMKGAEAYRQYEDMDAAVWTYQALLVSPELDDHRRALVHNRLALIHRDSGRSRKALTEFLEANILWEEQGEKWDEAVTAAFIAEGYHQLGKDGPARRYLESSFRALQACTGPDEKMARGMYYLAGSASTLGHLQIERKALEQGLIFAEPLEDPELFIELNDRLLRLPADR